MINTNKIVAASEFAGFQNYKEATFTATYSGGNLGIGGYTRIAATTPLNNINAISEVQVQYVGLDSFYRLVPGSIAIDYPTAGASQYQVNSIVYFTGGTLFVDNYIVNQTGGTVTVPAITFNCRAFLYIAPFTI